MLRLVTGELLGSARVWLGILVVAAGAAAAGAVAAALVTTAGDVGGDAGLALYGISGTLITTTAFAGGIVLTSVGQLTVSLLRRSHALWLLIGVRPGAVALVVLTQLLVVSAAGAVLGTLVAAPLLGPVTDPVFRGTPDLAGVHLHLAPGGAVGVVLAVCVLVLLSGVRPARRAGRVSPVELLQDPRPRRLVMGPARWATAALATGVLAGVTLGLPGRAVEDTESPLALVAPLAAVVLIALGPAVVPPLLRAWTGRVGADRSVAWFLGRHAASAAPSRTTAAVNPLVAGMALTGGLWAAHGAVVAAATARTGVAEPALPAAGVLLVLGGPLLVSLLGSAATVAMSGRVRAREAALVQAAGGTAGVVLAAALGEAVAVAGTAVLLAASAVGATALAAGWALGPAALAGALTTGTPVLAVTACAELLLVGLATVVPTALALRRRPTSVLAGA